MKAGDTERVSDYARARGCSTAWVYTLIENEKIEGTEVNGLRLVVLSKEDIDNYYKDK